MSLTEELVHNDRLWTLSVPLNQKHFTSILSFHKKKKVIDAYNIDIEWFNEHNELLSPIMNYSEDTWNGSFGKVILGNAYVVIMGRKC